MRVDSLKKFLFENVKLSPRCIEVQCVVILEFVVEIDGSITSINVLSSYCGACQEYVNDAVRIIKTMPKWNPAQDDGQPCRSYYQLPIAEANMIGISAGLALSGKIPFAGAFAGFISGRVYDQIRMTCAYSNLNVKIAASHAGITVGEDGATHQMMEDLGLMKMLPNMVVLNPCDYNQTRQATLAAARYVGPVYLRFGRPAVPNFTPADQPFEIGKGILMNEGTDVTIIATGHLVWHAMEAAYELE